MGRSHYSGPNRPSQRGTSKTSPSKFQAGSAQKQPTGGKVNKNPRGGKPRGSVHDMVF